MSHRTLSGLAILALGILLTLTMSTPTQAAPPDPYADLLVQAVELTDDGGCLASIGWSGLNGGKPLFVEVRLTFNNGGAYQTSWVGNADEIYKVKQNGGSLQVDLGAAAIADGTTDHRVQISFMDRSGVQIGPTYTADASCG